MAYQRTALLMMCLLTSLFAHGEERRISGLAAVEERFNENCAVCHGERMQGAPQGTPLVGQDLVHGDSLEALTASITSGFPQIYVVIVVHRTIRINCKQQASFITPISYLHVGLNHSKTERKTGDKLQYFLGVYYRDIIKSTIVFDNKYNKRALREFIIPLKRVIIKTQITGFHMQKSP